MLYVHGWSDYFFQTDLAYFWHEQGAAFYAIGLHNYGCSLRPRLVFGFVTNLQEYNELWRPRQGFPVPFAFLYAVMQGQAAVEEGLHLDLPVLVLLSDKSYLQPISSSDASSADVARNVDLVTHRSLFLGNYVTIARIPNALHDVILSAPEPRAHAYDTLSRWTTNFMISRRRLSHQSPI